mmetsp:Transcript_7182/g.15632  ORF Transcript_7182/g.15632 Transcript_7182/m.15632 type:complete len:274 (-) Transcript_7182:2005-2826(-)
MRSEVAIAIMYQGQLVPRSVGHTGSVEVPHRDEPQVPRHHSDELHARLPGRRPDPVEQHRDAGAWHAQRDGASGAVGISVAEHLSAAIEAAKPEELPAHAGLEAVTELSPLLQGLNLQPRPKVLSGQSLLVEVAQRSRIAAESAAGDAAQSAAQLRAVHHAGVCSTSQGGGEFPPSEPVRLMTFGFSQPLLVGLEGLPECGNRKIHEQFVLDVSHEILCAGVDDLLVKGDGRQCCTKGRRSCAVARASAEQGGRDCAQNSARPARRARRRRAR